LRSYNQGLREISFSRESKYFSIVYSCRILLRNSFKPNLILVYRLKRSSDTIYVKIVLKIVDRAQGHGANRFKSRAYTLVFEHFESVWYTALEC